MKLTVQEITAFGEKIDFRPIGGKNLAMGGAIFKFSHDALRSYRANLTETNVQNNLAIFIDPRKEKFWHI